jgi:plasmid stabilization system protein ParE
MAGYKLNEEADKDFERLFDYRIDVFGLEQAKH